MKSPRPVLTTFAPPERAPVTALAAAAWLLAQVAASAASAIWAGGGANNNWGNTNNWSASPVPGVTGSTGTSVDIATFATAANTKSFVDFTSATSGRYLTVGQLAVNADIGVTDMRITSSQDPSGGHFRIDGVGGIGIDMSSAAKQFSFGGTTGGDNYDLWIQNNQEWRVTSTTAGANLNLRYASATEGVTLHLHNQGTSAATTLTLNAGSGRTITLAGPVTGTGGFVKTGNGTVVLSNATNNYAGNTAVNAGRLTVNGNTPATDTVSVAANAKLSGTGTLAGPVTLATGNAAVSLTNGNTATLTFANGITLADGNVLEFDIGTSSDKIALTGGSLARTGTTTINFVNLGAATETTYDIIVGAGLTDTTGFVVGTKPSGFDATLQVTDGKLQVVLAAVAAPPDINVAASLTFATAAAWDIRDLNLTVQNTGGGVLNLASAAVSGPDLSQFSVVSRPATVLPGGQGTIVVRYAPTAAGNHTASLAIESNDPDESPVSVPLAGDSVAELVDILYAQATTTTNRWATNDSWSSASTWWDGDKPDALHEAAVFAGTPTRTAAVLNGGQYTFGQIKVTDLAISNMSIREETTGGGSITLNPAAAYGGIGIDMSAAASPLTFEDRGNWSLVLACNQEWRVTSPTAGANLTFNDYDSTATAITISLQTHTLTTRVGQGRSITVGQPVTGDGGITKTGNGALYLNRANTYTGPTLVSAGIFGGSGSLAGPLVLKTGATLAPAGNNVGMLTTAAVTLETGATLTAQINSATPAADLVNASGNVTIEPGVTLNLADLAGSPAALPNGAKLPLVNYSGATLTGTFDGLPQNAQVTVGPNTFVIDYDDQVGGLGNYITLTAVVTDPFLLWAQANITAIQPAAPAGFDEDADNDGLANGLEWILGGNPLAQDAAIQPHPAASAAGLTLTFTREEDSIGNATLVVEYDTNLDGIWDGSVTIAATGDGTPNANGVAVTINTSATPDAVTVTIPADPNAPDGRLFARLRASQP